MIQQHRQIDGRDFFWLVNNTEVDQDATVLVQNATGAASIWDAETGTVRPITSEVAGAGSRLNLSFKPNEAFYLVMDPKQPATQSQPELPMTRSTPLEGPWTWRIDALAQPPVPNVVALPPELISESGVERELVSWNQHGLEKFSGYVDYTTEVEISSDSERLILDLGRVQHLAEVWVNGQSVGSRLWAPYAFDVAKAARPGKNHVRVRVGNLISNNMGVPSESGLFGPVTLKAP